MGSARSRRRKHRLRPPGKRGQREVAKVEQEIAITEQLTDSGLFMEGQPWARYVASGGVFRLPAMFIHRWKQKRRGEWVAPLPWVGVVVGVGMLVVVFGVVGLFIWLRAH